jgi:chromosome segregation ATPase
MTKDALQKELQEKVRKGIKPSDLKKLKRSKSADDISSPSPPNPPLKKSQSQLEIPLQISSKQQITNLQEQIQFHSQAAQNYLKSLQSAQARVSELESPPSQLLQDQLREKQQQLEELRKDLEQTNLELNTLKAEKSSLLDDNLVIKHQSLKD